MENSQAVLQELKRKSCLVGIQSEIFLIFYFMLGPKSSKSLLQKEILPSVILRQLRSAGHSSVLLTPSLYCPCHRDLKSYPL